MARSDLLVSLSEAAIRGDGTAARATIEAIIAEERGKQHHVLADRLSRVLDLSILEKADRRLLTRGPRGQDLVQEIEPLRSLAEVRLTTDQRETLEEFLAEQRRSDILRSYGLEPRHTLLLQGEPGTGKTTIAEAIAYELAVPLYVVRYDQLIGSFLGETASRLKSAFDYIRTTHSVLFFDEFDAIAKERGDIHETGEIKRVVSSLLLQVDSLPSYNVIVAATNHPELLDRATWRRFEVRLALPMPTHEDVAEYLYLNLGTDLGKSAVSAQCLAGRLGAINYADLEQFCLQIRRAQILQIGSSSFEEIVDRTLSQVASESRHQD